MHLFGTFCLVKISNLYHRLLFNSRASENISQLLPKIQLYLVCLVNWPTIIINFSWWSCLLPLPTLPHFTMSYCTFWRPCCTTPVHYRFTWLLCRQPTPHAAVPHLLVSSSVDPKTVSHMHWPDCLCYVTNVELFLFIISDLQPTDHPAPCFSYWLPITAHIKPMGEEPFM